MSTSCSCCKDLTSRHRPTARLWTYVRDDRPFAGPAPPAALFHFSRDRTAEHPRRHLAAYAGILQADAYAGFGELYRPDRKRGPITEAACWAHFRRRAFELAEVARAPLGAEAVRRIDRVFDAEREVNGSPAADRLQHRQTLVAPLVADLHAWMLETRARLLASTISPRRWTTPSSAGTRSPGSSPMAAFA